MYNIEEVKNCINQLGSASSSETITQCNRYLTGFKDSQEAWAICRELLLPQNHQLVLFQSSQILYLKVKKEWYGLSDQQKTELIQWIGQLINQDFNHKPTHQKIAQIFAFIGILSINSQWTAFLDELFTNFNEKIVLIVLESIPYALDEFSIAIQMSKHIKSILSNYFTTIINFLHTQLQTDNYIQALEVLQSWKMLRLPIFQHNGLINLLMIKMQQSDQYFTAFANILIDSLGSSNASLALSEYGLNFQSILEQKLSQIEQNNILSLVQWILGVKQNLLNTSIDQQVRETGIDLFINLCTHFSFLLIQNNQTSQDMWQLLSEILLSGNNKIIKLSFDFWYDVRELALNKITDLSQRQWVLDNLLLCANNLISACTYTSHQQFLDAVLQKDEDDNFLDLRLGAEDIFLGVYLIFEKYEQNGQRFIQLVESLLQDQQPFKAEVYVHIIRSIHISLIENQQYFERILQILPTLPEDPLIVKSILYFYNEVGLYLSDYPQYFSQIILFILNKGLIWGISQGMYLDSNSLETLMSLTLECKNLFSQQLIEECLRLCQQIIPILQPNYVDKLIEAIINTLTVLPSELLTQGINQLLAPVIQEFNKLQLTNDLNCRNLFAKGIITWSSSLNALSQSNSQLNYQLLYQPLQQSLNIIINGILLFIDYEPFIPVITLFYKRIFKAFTEYSDTFFPLIAESINQLIGQKRCIVLSAMTQGLSILSNQEKTSFWINNQFDLFFQKVGQFIIQSQDPDAIQHIFEILFKIAEFHPQKISALATQITELTLYVIPYLTTRNCCKSVLQFIELIQSLQCMQPHLQQFSFQVTDMILRNLHNLNPNTPLFISRALKSIKTNFNEQYQLAAQQALLSELYQQFTELDKKRVYYCLTQASTENLLKQLLNQVTNILRGMGTTDSLIGTEFAVTAATSQDPVIIDLTKS